MRQRFGIEIDDTNLHFVNLDQQLADSLDPKHYPTFTLFWQAVAFIRVSLHATSLQPCDVFIDTMGVGFGYPFVQLLFGIRVYSYTHYPIVSEDMVKTVASKEVQFNNNRSISESPLKMSVKQYYYRLLIQFYKTCGFFADEVAANSSWTRAHMDSLWNKGDRIKTIYPPCDTSEFIKNISLSKPRENMMISFA